MQQLNLVPKSYQTFVKLGFTVEEVNEMVSLFNSGQTGAQVVQSHPQFFNGRDRKFVYHLRKEMFKRNWIKKSPVGMKMIATKSRLKSQATSKENKAKSTSSITSFGVTTIKEKVAASMLKIDFHGTIIHIEKTSNIIITKDQIVVR